MARELDPVSPIVGTSFGAAFTLVRQHDRAIQELLRVRDMDPNYYASAYFLAKAYAANSQYNKSIEMAETAAALSNNSPGALGLLGMAYGMAGRKAEARRVLERLLALSRQQYVAPTSFMDVYIGLGDRKNALDWLEKAYEERSYYVGYLKVVPAFDSLRSEPRFRDVLRKVFADQ
jgi:tetratricopeptide (TPR) repeat protein